MSLRVQVEAPLGILATATADEHGFLRPGAKLMVIILTDEADCSYDEDFEFELFSPIGDRLFFEEGINYPTSAVCWNAGVRCHGSPEAYDECRAVDPGVDGAPTSQADAALLHPIAGYVEQLAGLAGDRQVMVSIIAGVPQGYPEGDAALIYAERAAELQDHRTELRRRSARAPGLGLAAP